MQAVINSCLYHLVWTFSGSPGMDVKPTQRHDELINVLMQIMEQRCSLIKSSSWMFFPHG